MTVNSRLKSNPWLVLEIERTLNDDDIQCTSSLPQYQNNESGGSVAAKQYMGKQS